MSALGDRDAAARKAAPIARGVLWYFPDAIRELTYGTWEYCEAPAGATLLDCLLDLGAATGPDRVKVAAGVAACALDILTEELGGTPPVLPLPLSGVIDAYAQALAAVAEVSLVGAVQHCGGVLGWARGKSTDHADCIVRHFVDRGSRDTDGGLHSAKVAWRALALLQTEIEAAR